MATRAAQVLRDTNDDCGMACLTFSREEYPYNLKGFYWLTRTVERNLPRQIQKSEEIFAGHGRRDNGSIAGGYDGIR
ncbi:MAG: hypothetical protein R3B95_01390 [Nitrospirales bacterium]|nr:hypothetical protein [Nitrospirales bacterium]